MDAIWTLRFEREPDGPRRFVVGVDGSETSWRALCYAFGLARRQRGSVLAVFADVPCRAVEPDRCPDDTWSARERLVAELRDAIATLADEHQVPAGFVTTRCEPVESLIGLAAEHRADAIIVGASRALAHKLFGSTAVRTVRRSRCPVTVVP
jgi:nucleotide-binding universal stress UspA family protein